LDLNSEDSMSGTLKALTKSGLLRRYDRDDEAVYSISPGKQLAAAYYRNTIIHYFLSSALAEVALAALTSERVNDTVTEVDRQLMSLRDLLKFEFFFRKKDAFRQDAAEYLNLRYPGWQQSKNTDCSPFQSAPPLFGHSILRSFIEAYFILSRSLLSATDAAELEPKRLVGSCLALGEELLARRTIRCETALSQPLLETAVRLAGHRGLLTVDAEDLEARGNQFAVEMDHTLEAINRLQRDYDRYQLGITCAN
jgi:glycerol-3-phosphate O-acyltransferase